MKIAIVSSTFDSRHRRRLAIVEGLRSLGHECQIFSINYPWQDVSNPDGVILTHGFKRSKLSIKNAFSMRALKKVIIRKLTKFDPQCILVMDPDLLFAGIYFKRKKNIRFVYDVQEFHGHTTKANITHRKWVEKKERYASEYIDQILVLSNPMKAFMKKKVQEQTPINIISNAISDWSSSPYNGHLHAAANLPSQARILLYHGYLVPHRGLELLAECSQYIKPPWHIILMGWGPLAESLKILKSSTFTVIDPVLPEDLLSAISGADIGVILYDPINLNHKYSTPNKLYEYPAAGVPILSADLSEITPVIQKFDIGWVLPKANVTESILETLVSFDDVSASLKRENCKKFIQSVTRQNNALVWQNLIIGEEF